MGQSFRRICEAVASSKAWGPAEASPGHSPWLSGTSSLHPCCTSWRTSDTAGAVRVPNINRFETQIVAIDMGRVVDIFFLILILRNILILQKIWDVEFLFHWVPLSLIWDAPKATIALNTLKGG